MAVTKAVCTMLISGRSCRLLTLDILQILAIPPLPLYNTHLPRTPPLSALVPLRHVLRLHWLHRSLHRSNRPAPTNLRKHALEILQRLSSVGSRKLDCRRSHEDVLVFYSDE
jgi:hypothetical protein